MSAIEITHKNFEEAVEKPGILVLDWWASWCAPCRAFAPIFEKVAAKNTDITWGKVNTDAERELSATFQIRSIPTLMVFREGVLVFEQPGMLPEAALERLIGEIRGLDMEEVRKKAVEHEAHD